MEVPGVAAVHGVYPEAERAAIVSRRNFHPQGAPRSATLGGPSWRKGERMKILLVDDSAATALVMKNRLTNFGHDVVLATNGSLGVDLFRKAAPDLVIMDIEMPVMNGFEAANRIRVIESNQQWAWTPIIFLTASDTVENLITAIEAGGDDFMAKVTPEPVLHAKMKAMARIATLRQRLSVANHKLEQLANSDGLTGLCNRRSMDQRVNLAHARANESGGSLALLMIDIDNFKKYNDHYGHQAGDDCLRLVAQTLATVVDAAQAWADGAFAARYGGEEFAVVLPQSDAHTMARLAQALLEGVRQLAAPHAANPPWGIVTVSIGGALVSARESSVADWFRVADQRLYQAKAQGRNGYC